MREETEGRVGLGGGGGDGIEIGDGMEIGDGIEIGKTGETEEGCLRSGSLAKRLLKRRECACG
jgi:hypothetical protein